MKVRTKPAMRKGMLRSVLVCAFSVGLAAMAFSGLDAFSDADAAAPRASASEVTTQDVIWGASAKGDVVWASAGKGDVIWTSAPAGGSV